MNADIERRRTVRLKRSALLKSNLDKIDRPAIKFAETQDEHEQAFALVYQAYVQSGYIPNPSPDGKVSSIYSFLPETFIFIAKSYQSVISTLTQIFDSKLFGLPLDSMYREELKELREKGRTIAEIGALATKKDFRWQNLFMVLCQIMYWYARYKKVSDLCITVNPKHFRFYKTIFLFEEFGPKKQHPKFATPVVLLRLNMDEIETRTKKAYDRLDFDCNLYDYFHRMGRNQLTGDSQATGNKGAVSVQEKPRLDIAAVNALTKADKSVFQGLTPDQKDYILKLYPGLQL